MKKKKLRYLSGRENDLNQKKSRLSDNNIINELVYEWFCAARTKGYPISGPILQETAKKIALKLANDSFQASNGWLRCFRNKYSITFNTASGEENEVNPTTVQDWKEKLAEITEGYDQCNIANCDETALFYRALPNKTLHLKGQKCSRGKFSKERLTLFLLTFADGTFDKPIVIGKSQKPRCFKRLNTAELPVHYYANSKAWMTSETFLKILRDLNKRMKDQNRRILLFMDNATCHPRIQLSNIKVQYFPPNTTSKLQPLDSGIIQNIKLNYRKLILQKLLLEIDRTQKASDGYKSITILDSIMILQESINKVLKTTAVKCFQHCGFNFENYDTPSVTENENGVVEVQNMIGAIYSDHAYSAADYINVDSSAITEVDDINPDNLLEEIIIDSDDEENLEVEDVEEDPPTKEEVLKSLKILEHSTMHLGETDLFKELCNIKFKFLSVYTKRNSMKQLKISNYFQKESTYVCM